MRGAGDEEGERSFGGGVVTARAAFFGGRGGGELDEDFALETEAGDGDLRGDLRRAAFFTGSGDGRRFCLLTEGDRLLAVVVLCFGGGDGDRRLFRGADDFLFGGGDAFLADGERRREGDRRPRDLDRRPCLSVLRVLDSFFLSLDPRRLGERLRAETERRLEAGRL